MRRVRHREHPTHRHLRFLAAKEEQTAPVRAPHGLRLVVDVLGEALGVGDLVARDPRDRRLVATAHVRREGDALAIRSERSRYGLTVFALARIEKRRISARGRDHVRADVGARLLATRREDDLLAVW